MALWRIDGIKIPIGKREDELILEIASLLDLPAGEIRSLTVIRKSVDARRRGRPRFVYAVEVTLPDGVVPPGEEEKGVTIRRWTEKTSPPFPAVSPPQKMVVIAGTGPAGLFAALTLAEMGIPSLLLERGKAIPERVTDVETFWEKGTLNEESHVHFGEGGAGTFSDGKLTSRVRNPHTGWIKGTLVELGAPSEIITSAKPHVGTDRLRDVVVNLRNRLLGLGCDVRFGAKVTDFLIHRGRIGGLVVNGSEEIRTDHLLLATGQSASDIYERLYARGVQMVAKPFAMGLRVEHPQALIDNIQYGRWAGHPDLPPADYFLTARVAAGGRSVYTFCMCPGGSIIGCSSHVGEIVTNGMSDQRRDAPFANSACVVTVGVNDFEGEGDSPWPLSGLAFRRRWEERAFLAGGGDYRAPAQRLTDFLMDRPSPSIGYVSFRPGGKAANLASVLPGFVTEALKGGFRQFEGKMPGFVTAEATLFGVETRTSSPVRILRGMDGQSVSVAGVYPCGEGAGYAGGIISSALDGIRAAHLIGTGCR